MIYDTIKGRTRGKQARVPSQEDLIEVIDVLEGKNDQDRKTPEIDEIKVVEPKQDKRRKGTPKKETKEVVESKVDEREKANEKEPSESKNKNPDSNSESSWEVDLPLTGPEESPKKYAPAPSIKLKTTTNATSGKESEAKSESSVIGEKRAKKRDREEYREKPFVPSETISKDEWNCIMCFLPNLMEDVACVRCLTNRPGAKKTYRWTCATCTTSNPKSVTVCRLCNSDSSSSSGSDSS